MSVAGLPGSTPRSCGFNFTNVSMTSRKTNIGIGRSVILARQTGQNFGRSKMLRGSRPVVGAFLNHSRRQWGQNTWPQGDRLDDQRHDFNSYSNTAFENIRLWPVQWLHAYLTLNCCFNRGHGLMQDFKSTRNNNSWDNLRFES